MGKKSKRRPGKRAPRMIEEAKAAAPQAPVNPIQKVRVIDCERWEIVLACSHPLSQGNSHYLCIDAESEIKKQHGGSKQELVGNMCVCPVCFEDAPWTCSRCGTVSYCGSACQLVHWKQSHRKACKPNPREHKFKLKLSIFRGLTEDCFAGHKFLVIRPTEQLDSLQTMCEQVFESADDLLEMSGFGENHLSPGWLDENERHPACQQLVRRFGWMSGRINSETVCGYRAAESKFIYFCFFDADFQNQTDQAPSYYGRALFPPMPEGKHGRGKLVIYKLFLSTRRLLPSSNDNGPSFCSQMTTDDAELQFVYTLQPINKAEIALMVSERCKAMDAGSYTTRQWRHVIRTKERKVEMKAARKTSSQRADDAREQ